jgi:hypothetical protein
MAERASLVALRARRAGRYAAGGGVGLGDVVAPGDAATPLGAMLIGVSKVVRL